MCELENGDIESRLPIGAKAAIMEQIGGIRLQSKHWKIYQIPLASEPSSGQQIANVRQNTVAWVFLYPSYVMIDGDVRALNLDKPYMGYRGYIACQNEQTPHEHQALANLAGLVRSLLKEA